MQFVEATTTDGSKVLVQPVTSTVYLAVANLVDPRTKKEIELTVAKLGTSKVREAQAFIDHRECCDEFAQQKLGLPSARIKGVAAPGPPPCSCGHLWKTDLARDCR
jgi:hypothetical protein